MKARISGRNLTSTHSGGSRNDRSGDNNPREGRRSAPPPRYRELRLEPLQLGLQRLAPHCKGQLGSCGAPAQSRRPCTAQRARGPSQLEHTRSTRHKRLRWQEASMTSAILATAAAREEACGNELGVAPQASKVGDSLVCARPPRSAPGAPRRAPGAGPGAGPLPRAGARTSPIRASSVGSRSPRRRPSTTIYISFCRRRGAWSRS